MISTSITRSALLSGLALTFGLGISLTSTPAEAGRGKDYFSEVYKFNKPHDGYSGFSGAYFCDYQRKPNIECKTDKSGNQKCVRKGWLLRQHCY